MRRRAAAFRRARTPRATPSPALPPVRRPFTVALAIGMLSVASACAGDEPAEVASETPTVPAVVPTDPATTPGATPSTTPAITPDTTTSVTSTPSTTRPSTTRPSTTRPSTTRPSTVASTQPGDRSAVRLALQAARDRWNAAGVQTYEHRYSVRCACEPLAATVRVLGGRVLGAVTGQGLELATVAEWFDEVGRAIETADTVEVDFDDDLGHPLHVLIDPDAATADDEYGLDTAGFRVVGDPVRRWFTDTWACGYQLVAAVPDQSAALVLQVGDTDGGAGPFEVAALPVAEVRFGTDLMAGWCDDTRLPAAPSPVLDTTWKVVGGTLDLEVDRRSATGGARGLLAVAPSGLNVELGSVELRNDAWGGSAG